MTTPEPSEHQSRQIQRVCDFIAEHTGELIPCAGDSRWTEGHILFRYESDQPGMYAYMTGPLKNGRVSLHLMPLYALPELRDKYLEAFEPFAAGKSCIHFAHFDELPFDALADIVENGTPRFKAAMEARLPKKPARPDKKDPPLALL